MLFRTKFVVLTLILLYWLGLTTGETKKSWIRPTDEFDTTFAKKNREHRLKPLEETTDNLIRSTRDTSTHIKNLLSSTAKIKPTIKSEHKDSNSSSIVKNGLKLLIMGR